MEGYIKKKWSRDTAVFFFFYHQGIRPCMALGGQCKERKKNYDKLVVGSDVVLAWRIAFHFCLVSLSSI